MKTRYFFYFFTALMWALNTSAVTVINASDSGAGSLRDTIAAASPGDTITFTNALDGATILLTGGQIILDKNLTIDASALSNGLTVSGNNSSRIFRINSGTTNALQHLTLTEGNGVGAGANGFGGAIFNEGNLLISASTIHGNTAGAGGAIFSAGGSSQLTLSQCTVSGNTAGFGGAFLFRTSGAVTLAGCTVYGNAGTGGTGGIVLESSASLTLQNTILAGNERTDNSSMSDLGGLGGSVTLAGYNLIGVQSVGYADVMPVGNPNINGDYVGTSAGPLNPLLAPLIDYGGPTRTMPPLPGSPAIDAGNTSLTNSPTDQRGLARVVNGTVDIGAIETGNPIPAFYVNTALDEDDGLATNNVSLRDAIAHVPPGSTIVFAPALSGETILLTNGQLVVDYDLNIDASALAGGIVIDGNGLISSNRIFEIGLNTTAVFDSLTLTNGLLSTNQYTTSSEEVTGGAVYMNSGADLTLSHSTVAGNKALGGGAILVDSGARLTLNHSSVADNTAGAGGGIMLQGAGTVTLNHSTLAGNTALSDNSIPANGGGIYNLSGTVTLNHSTLAGNSASTDGGGIVNGGTLMFNYSTLAGNSASSGGGILNGGTVTLNNSTLAGNSASADGGGILNGGTVTLNNSTLAGNSASNGGGINSLIVYFGGTFAITINNSILTDNSATLVGGGIYIEATAFVESATIENSIIAENSAPQGDNTYGVFVLPPSSVLGLPPRLAPLGDYGGATQTMPPLPGSPAIDAGNTSATNSLTDQHGMPRVLSGSPGNIPTVDIGAVEYSGWLPGTDLSGLAVENLFIPAASYYDAATLFPAGFDPAAADLLLIQSQVEIEARTAQTIAAVSNNPTAYGLYNESAFQALALDRPFLSHNAGTGTFTLKLGVLQAPDLFSPFNALTNFTTIPYPADGEIDIEFEAPNSDVRFFEVYGAEPAP